MSTIPPTSTTPIPDPSTLTLPRILCLHGGGVNGQIFRLQLRSFLNHTLLKSRFRFVFVEAPFLCDAGAGVLPVFADYSPFRRWFRWLPDHEAISDEECRELVVRACIEAMERDDALGAKGEWVATLGFSQGAKVAVSLLYEMQVADGEGLEVSGRKVQWRFAVVLAGRAPFVALSEMTQGFGWCQKAGGLPETVDMDSLTERPEMKLVVPTVHVHGLKDEGLTLHRRLLDEYCAPGTATLVEWDGYHRVPLKKGDVDRVVQAIVDVADEYGV